MDTLYLVKSPILSGVKFLPILAILANFFLANSGTGLVSTKMVWIALSCYMHPEYACFAMIRQDLASFKVNFNSHFCPSKLRMRERMNPTFLLF